MKSGYKIIWSDHALNELSLTIDYLETFFTDKEISRLAQEIERILHLISINPKLFPLSDKKNFRKVVIAKFNTLYYQESGDIVEIISFFSNRKNPEARKI